MGKVVRLDGKEHDSEGKTSAEILESIEYLMDLAKSVKISGIAATVVAGDGFSRSIMEIDSEGMRLLGAVTLLQRDVMKLWDDDCSQSPQNPGA